MINQVMTGNCAVLDDFVQLLKKDANKSNSLVQQGQRQGLRENKQLHALEKVEGHMKDSTERNARK